MLKAFLNKALLLFFVLTLAAGCFKKESLTNFDCEELAMKDFKGLPSHGQVFKEHCLNRDLKFTRKVCQQAFNDLLFGKKIDDIKKTYGDRVISCFNERELQKYAPNQLNNDTK